MFKHTILSTIKYLASSLVLLLLLASCKDSNIGVVVRPGEDSLNVKTALFPLETQTIYYDGIYSESDKVVLGRYSDNVFGSFKLDFLSEFRYIRDLSFPDGAVGDELCVVMYYRGFFGDSSAVHEATVYQLDKKALDFSENYTSDIDISEFCSKNIVLGSQRYVAYDKTISDAQRAEANYCNKVKVAMPKQMMTDLMTHPEIYKSQDAFLSYFKGVYVTNTYGQQTVLEIDSVNLELSYHYSETLMSKITKQMDSVVVRNKMALFPANRETTEVIHVESKPVDVATIPDSLEYISSPCGTLVEVNIPYMQIYREVVEQYRADNEALLNFNYFSVVVEEAQVENESFRTTAPTYLIMIRLADAYEFFHQSLYPVAGIHTILGANNFYGDGGRYVFGNSGKEFEDIMFKAMNMGSDAEREAYFNDLNPYVIVPISGATNISGTDATIRPLFDPYGIRVRSGRNTKSPMSMVVTFTNL